MHPNIEEDVQGWGGGCLTLRFSHKWFVGGGEPPLVLKLDLKLVSDEAPCLMSQ